jgi:hypothetical protein
MFKWMRRRAEPERRDHEVVVRLNARLQPINRGDLFEDPLDATLRQAGLGQVTGGGTHIAQGDGGIAACDLDLSLLALDEPTLTGVIGRLEELGAPKGSRLLLEDGHRERTFGHYEGLALMLNGTDLPKEVYETQDVNDLIGALRAALGTHCHYMDFWQGPLETSLFFYGPAYDEMSQAIAPVRAREALCERSRIEKTA